MRNTSGLRRGGPGRPKGAKNKATQEVQEFWREFLASESYTSTAMARILAGKAPHLETYWVNRLHGKPVEKIELTGADGGPIEVHDHFTVAAPTGQ